MSDSLKQWLKIQLDGLVSVRTTAIRDEPDLIAYLWSGVKIHVYIIKQEVRLRAIKRALQDASNIGIGSMFIVSAHLVPNKGERAHPDEWLQALHALSGDQLYTYHFTAKGVEITQVHLESVGGLGKWEVHHGPAFQFQRIRFYSTSIKQPRGIRGSWLVADFDTPAFWKENDYRRHREERRQQQRRTAGNTQWHTWSGYQTWQNTNGNTSQNATSPIQTYLHQCYHSLGVKADAGRDEVKSAYRKLAREVHPDVSDLPKEEAEIKFKALTEAYEYIKAARDWT